MQSFFSCFSCSQKASNTVTPMPQPINLIDNLNQSKLSASLIQDYEDNKSRTNTTAITFKTHKTSTTKDQNEQQSILHKIQMMRKLTLPERKALENQFIRQNLFKTQTIYLVQKQWSQQYTKFLKDIKIQSIEPINNYKILDANGKLLSTIQQKDDYYVINQKVWKFIKALYGGGPEIKKDIYFPVYTLLSKKQQLPSFGIQNPLNLCYMISVMQCICSIQQFASYMLKKLYIENTESKKKIFHTIFHKFIKQILDTKQPIQSIKQFASSFQNKFNPYEQHDAHEFILYLFENIQQQFKNDKNIPLKQFKDPQSAYSFYFNVHRSIINKIFAGQQEGNVICMKCQNVSTSYIPFLEISLEIVDNTLQGCLKKHFSEQRLDDLYDCEKCKKKCKAIKQCSISKTPNFLMIAMKKFSSSGRKIQEKIKYPYNLDIKKYCKDHHGQTKFMLHSIIVHKGTRSNKGHYFCYTRRNKNDWYYCNDDLVQKIQASDSLSRDCYILIYERLK